MNTTIFKQTMKSNLKLWLIFTFILVAFNVIMIAVFEPNAISGVTDMVKGTPLESLLQNTSFLGMLAQTFFSLHGVILPLVFVIMTANNLVAAQVDRGSMAYLLSTPIKRTTVVGTQAIYLFTAITAMFIFITVSGVLAIKLFQGDADVEMNKFLLLNVGLYLLMFATSGISFLFSCVFNLSKNSLALGAGIPLAFFLCQLMGQVSESLDWMKYFSMNTLFNTENILNGESYALSFSLLVVIGIVLYILGIRIFSRKDLPL